MRDVSLEFRSLVLNKLGLDLSIFSKKYFDKVVQQWMSQKNFFSIEDIRRYFDITPDISNSILNIFLNHYSEFFRNPSAFLELQNHVLQKLSEHKNHGEPIRIWNVGCSKGQEPYSIAIACFECMKSFDLSFDFTIFATDIDEEILQIAKTGVYTKNELKNITLGQLDEYFVKSKKGYKVQEFVKAKVHFSYHNIILQDTKYPVDSIYGDFDLIMIANVLIYYNEDIQKDVIHQLISSLNNNGYLISSRSERQLLMEYMDPIAFNSGSTIFYKKEME